MEQAVTECKKFLTARLSSDQRFQVLTGISYRYTVLNFSGTGNKCATFALV